MSEGTANNFEANSSCHNKSLTEIGESRKRKDYIEWDEYFMATAALSAKRSKDPETQVGACIIDEEKRIVAIGYNGFPRNCSDDVFPWGKSKEKLKDKNTYVVHAEANAILNKNIANLKNTKLYTTLFPCNECAKLIIQAGISEVIYLSNHKSHKPKYQAAEQMFDAAGVKCKMLYPKQTSIVIDLTSL